MKRVYVNEEVCIGCRLCEIHCVVQHSKSKKIIKVFKEEIRRPLARVLVEEKGPISFALQCRHCNDAPCIQACITGALYKNNGFVLHNKEKCIGCWTCIMTCPFGAIKRDEVAEKVASKCDLCFGEEVPVCVRKCPNEALVYEDVPPGQEKSIPILNNPSVSLPGGKTDQENPISYVIIGNSVAAIGAIEAIRTNDQENPITVVSDEPHHTYSRPLISMLLSGKVTEDRMYYRDADFYEKNKVTPILGKKAKSINVEDKVVILEDDQKIPYDKLLIATGGKPFVPPMKGLDKYEILTFTKWDEVKKIKAMAKSAKHVVVVGGGFIGLKVAESLNELGVKVVVVELLDRILGLVLDNIGSKIIHDRITEAGIEIVTENTIQEIVGSDSKITHVILKDGQKMDCDMVIVAIGVRSNIEIVENTPVEVNRGIVVNNKMETSVSDIYAAGDVAEAYDMLYESKRTTPILPSAYAQGKIAGDNMSKGASEFPGDLPMNSIEFYGLPFMSIGIVNPEIAFPDDGFEAITDTSNLKNNVYKKIILKDNRIIGAILIGAIDRAGIITGLIKDKVDVTPFKENLLDDEFGLISFPKELRKEKLRCVV